MHLHGYRTLAVDIFNHAAIYAALFYLLSATMVDAKPIADEGMQTQLSSLEYSGTHKCLYANIRGLRQCSGELAAIVEMIAPHFVFLTECHIATDELINK